EQPKYRDGSGHKNVPNKTLCKHVNTVTTPVENRKAQLVMIAHGIDPGELVVFLPALISVAFTLVNPKDKEALGEIHCHWNGNILGLKSVAHIAKLEKTKAKELPTKLGWMYQTFLQFFCTLKI
uniref:Ribosomal protein eL8/eL30/eS12/Gadd45 domain-containing protein n=1 Tax=Varanus komodoensis TaxID=61221 RepID=A0A8D2L403_VARKO